MSLITAYRDDGPLAEFLRRVPFGPAVFGALVGAAVVAGGVLIGGTDPSDALVVSVAVLFVLVGALAGGGAVSRFDWLEPAAIRAGEYGFLLWLGATTDRGLPAAYALLSALAFHHYDTVYRLRHLHIAPPRWLAIAGGWEGRVLAAAAVFAIDPAAIRPVFFITAAVLGTIFVVESVRTWVRAGRPVS